MQQMMRWFVAGLLVLAAVACGKDGGGGKAKREKPAKLTIAEVLGSTKAPALIGPFASGKLGMTKEELEAAVPVFKEKGDYLSHLDYGIGFYAGFEGPPSDPSAKKLPKRFTALGVTLTDADAKAVATAWGAPVEITDRGKKKSAWFNPGAKIRAVMEDGEPGEKKLWIKPYIPAKEILGEPGKPLGIEAKKALIGSTAAELTAAYPENFERDMSTLVFMSWDPDELGDAFKMELGTKDGKVESLQFWLTHGDNPTVKADLKALLEAKFGPAKEVDTPMGKKTHLSESPKVTLAETTGAWVVEIGYPY